MEKSSEWWKRATIYHIYPQSFKDTNGDGIGDLEGIIEKLDYLANLGIDAIWLSPIYASPLKDGGYDITDHTALHPQYGTIDDLKRLIALAHEKGIHIIMDLVLNHTSIQHPWFQSILSPGKNEKKEWYIWHPGRNGRKPNNWKTNFGKSAWTFRQETGCYYYHSYFPEQPDLNWRNPEVKEAMFNVIKFWLDMGVDGFRLDVVNMLYKNEKLPDNPIWAALSNTQAHNRNQPEVYGLLKEFRCLLNEYPDKTSIGEIYVCPPGDPELVASFTGNGNDMLHMAFDFSLVFARWSASQFYQYITRYYKALGAGGWPCLVFSNHDLGRGINHYFTFGHKKEKAKILATLLLTLKGTPCIYYGDEIGMQNANIHRKELRDRYGKMFYPLYQGRDKARTPMQWEETPFAGFSTVQPWLPVNKNYPEVNVRNAIPRDDSIYNWYRQLIHFRKNNYTLREGDIMFLNKGREGFLFYKRYTPEECIYILINFSLRKKEWNRITDSLTVSEILFSSRKRNKEDSENRISVLYPREVIIFKVLV